MDIDPTLISSWKQSFGKIYNVSVGGQEYVFRALTFHEYDVFAMLEESMGDVEEEIIDKALLWPEEIDLNRLKAGYITSLAEEILDVSAFRDIQTARVLLEEERQEAVSFRFNMKAFVLAVRPTWSEDHLDHMSFSQLAHEVAMAERIIAVQQAIFGVPESGVQLEIVDPAELEEADRQSQSFDNIPDPGDIDRNIDSPTTLGTAKVGDPIADRLHQALGG